jgi:hypothetical protein
MTDKICKISLFSFILACVSVAPGDAAVKSNNAGRSHAAAYQQVTAFSAQQEYLNANYVEQTLPITVEDATLANAIANNSDGAPSVSDLESCALIYPNGSFRWGTPEYGMQKNPQCIAVVELRDATSNAVLATTTVAAGQSIKCNIDSFPPSSYNMSALSQIELPADEAPTMEDVIAVMNEEQKQNAGLKIAAGAIIAGVAGNLLSPKSAGEKEGKLPIGTGSSQLIGTAIGAAAGAGIMAASTYSGKVAGDTIKSTSVNAASGMIIGNMMAGAGGGDDVLATTKCTLENSKTEYDCIAGKYETYGEQFPKTKQNENGETVRDTATVYLIKQDGTDLHECKIQGDTAKCQRKSIKNLGQISVQTNNNSSRELIEVKSGNTTNIDGWIKQANSSSSDGAQDDDSGNTTNTITFRKDAAGTLRNDAYLVLESASEVTKTENAYAIFMGGLPKKLMGYKPSDWNKMSSGATLYYRYSGGSVGAKIEQPELANFKPSSRSAEDGDLIDLSNGARTKGTLVGTAAGGALGGFAGYQGAKDEISQRWVSSLREYEDSLSSVVCFTGARYLSKYNDYADIPKLEKK